MNILIDAGTLNPQGSDTLFRSHALGALIKLHERGCRLSLQGSLNESQEALLQQEGLSFQQTGDNQAGITISLTGNELSFTDVSTGSTHTHSSWAELPYSLLFPDRRAEVQRKTNETDISLKLNVDGTGKSNITTGLGFFDHMLDQIAKHGHMDLDLQCKGDLHIDEHHTIEDTALVLGQAISEAVGDKRGIGRYGFIVPMDESRAIIALDLSGRPWLEYQASFTRDMVGGFPTEMVKHFFYSLAMSMKATLHIEISGDNDHHKIEAMFKGLAKCLRQALDQNEKYADVLPSSKGKL